jgi:hypothetical protein
MADALPDGREPPAPHRCCPLAWLAALLLAGCGRPPGRAADALPPGDYTPRRVSADFVMPEADASRLRADALARAQVWRPPEPPVERASLGGNPEGFAGTDALTCRFLPRASDGRTPKFHCVLPGGDVIKVKYGRQNHERLAEVAGSRLALALGFGADRMFVVRRVTCWGCPRYPYPRLPWLDGLLADFSRSASFEHAVIEREFPGREIRTDDAEGWGWNDLDSVDAARGGATRGQLDAFRLFAVFLGHWDNKAENQRLTCLSGGEAPDGGCAAPFALIHDFGATFGPRRAELRGWSERPVWRDGATCTVSMRGMPYDGGTFTDRRISEAGRALLGDLLRRLSREQVTALFTGARFGEQSGGNVDGWVHTFEDRVRQVVDRGPCPEV